MGVFARSPRGPGKPVSTSDLPYAQQRTEVSNMTLGRQRGPRGRSRDRTRELADREQDAITESVVNIRRVAKTVAGGRRFTFNALVVVGDGQGRVGFGLGKASEVPDAVQKGSAIARRSMRTVPLVDNTVPQNMVSKFGGAQILLKPAAPGTGVRASAAVRAVVQAAGVRDILTKSQGSNNPINVVQATIRGMEMMRNPEEVMALRRMVRGEPPLPTGDEATEALSPADATPAAPVDPPAAIEASHSDEPPVAAEPQTGDRPELSETSPSAETTADPESAPEDTSDNDREPTP